MMIAANKENGLRFDCIEKITNTAASLPAEFIPDLKKIFPNALVFKMYGLTECKRVCYLEPELIDQKPNSVGKAIPGTEVFLLSSEGQPVPAGETGILHIRGPHVMLGYLNKKELSAEMLRDGQLPGEKILCSNDWFKMDEEGFLYFQGRNDDIIKTRGEKVSPVEIENLIYKIKGIKEVAVMGVPDVILGESIVVYATLHDLVQLSEKEVQKECIKHLEAFMIPKKVFFLDKNLKDPRKKLTKRKQKKCIKMKLSGNEIQKHFNLWLIAWSNYDIESVMEFIDDDIIFENWDGRIISGKSNLEKSWKAWFILHGNFKFIKEDILIDEENQKIAFTWELEWLSLEKNYVGRPEKRRGVDILYLNEGKILRKLTYSKTTLQIDSLPVAMQAICKQTFIENSYLLNERM